MNVKTKKMVTYALFIIFFVSSMVISSVLNEDIIQSDNALNYINNGNILYVGGDGANNYTKIQDAINDAINGDTIFVYDDSSPYYENIVINKSINLIGENRNTIICGNDSSSNNSIGEKVISVEANFVNISNFTITTRKSEYLDVDGIFIWRDHVRISDCNFYNLRDAITCCGGPSASDIFVSNCKFWGPLSVAVHTGEENNYVVSNCDIEGGWVVICGNNTTVLNCIFHPGTIWISDCDNNKIMNNYIEDGALKIDYSAFNILRNNTLVNSGLELLGHGVEDFQHDIDTSNTMQGKPIYYFYNKTNFIIDENNDVGYVILASCQNITVKNLELFGAFLAFSSNNSFENCSFWGNLYGLYFHNSTCNSVSKCHFENPYPLMIEQSSRNNISYCTFSELCANNIEIWHSSNENMIFGCNLEGNGISIEDSNNNMVIKCTISNAECGIEIDGDNNVVSLCNISHNGMGIFVGGYNNKIYFNNFVRNRINAFCYGWNVWNTRDGGNYWSNYHGFDLNKDGIGELPYHIKTDIAAIPLYMESFFNFDWRPLMNPIKSS